MSAFSKNRRLQLIPLGGATLNTAISEAIEISKSENMPVSFVFNGQEVVVDKTSTLESVYAEMAKKREQDELVSGFKK